MRGNGPAERPLTLPPRRIFGGAASLALLGALGCGGEDVAPAQAAPAPDGAAVAAAIPAEAPATPCGAPADCYFEAYLAETVTGERGLARERYEAVLESTRDRDPELAARAALRLAELEAQAGRRREALDLVARAAALGNSTTVLDAAESLRVRLASVEGDDAPVRGPAAGTALDGISSEAADRFQHAEELLVGYHATHVRPRLEALSSAQRRKERALEEAVRAYRKVVALGEPTASCAAEFRVGSLYHDYALSQAFEFPPELLPELAEALRKNLRKSAANHLRKARAAYDASWAVAESAATSTWRKAARAGARAVEDLARRLDPRPE